MSGALAWGVDAASNISLATLRAQGATFLCCYLAPYPAESWKIRTPAEIKAYLDAGQRIVFNWESDGTPGVGRQTGIDAAEAAQQLLTDRHCSDAPVIFTFADSATADPAAVASAIAGAISVMSWDRVGAYGDQAVIKYLADRNACHYYWQTYAWSNGQWDPRAQLRQWKNTTTLDYDEAWALDFGQYPRPAAPPPVSAAVSVGGAIGAAYDALGGAAKLGTPLGAEGNAADGGRWQPFTNGVRIYWHPTRTKGVAYAVWGEIAKSYATYAPGKPSETGWLGYPIGPELPATNGGRAQDFENGIITWSASTGAQAMGSGLASYWRGSTGKDNITPLALPSSSEAKEQFAVVELADKSHLFWRYSTNTPYHAA